MSSPSESNCAGQTASSIWAPPPFDAEAAVDDEEAVDSSDSPTSGGSGSTPLSAAPDTLPYPHCPIYIPSRGRFEQDRGTFATFIRDLVPFTVVVEPQEKESYAQHLDHLVFEAFGASGMVHAVTEEAKKENAGAADGDGFTVIKPEKDSSPHLGTTPSAPSSTLPIVRCGCCVHGESRGCSKKSENQEKLDALQAKRVATMYHHGYIFAPTTTATSAAAGSSMSGASPASGSGTNSPTSAFPSAVAGAVERVPVPEFVLHSVEEVRALFRIEVLPEGNRGVSYVRNHILHVLVPREMIASGIDGSGNIEELGLFTSEEPQVLSEGALVSLDLDPSFYKSLKQKMRPGGASEAHKSSSSSAHSAITGKLAGVAPHPLFGFYWVLDDDIYSLCMTSSDKRNVRVSAREMMRQVQDRIIQLQHTADATPPDPRLVNNKLAIFTGKDDVILNNILPMTRQQTNLSLATYPYYTTTACYSLEYSRFAYTYDTDALAVNSYNNIACLFSYQLLHNPQQTLFFPATATAGLRNPREVLTGFTGTRGPVNMMWYRFAVREDYDFTLQLIARGMYTLRFRNLSFEVPQMAKARGGMTDYYKTQLEDIKLQNKRFLQQWPSIAQHWVKGKNKTEREDIRVRWDLLNPMRARYPGGFLFMKEPLPFLQPQRRPANPSSPPLPLLQQSLQQQQQQTLLQYPGQQYVSVQTRRQMPPEKRGRDSSDLESAEYGEEAEEASNEGEVPPRRQPPPPLAAVPAAPPHPSNAIGRNHGESQWRDISPPEAAQLGLRLMSPHDLFPGQTVAVIPPLFTQNPCVVKAVLIERFVARNAEGEVVKWTAIVPGVRSIPLLSVVHCYVPPASDEELEVIRTAVDKFFGKAGGA